MKCEDSYRAMVSKSTFFIMSKHTHHTILTQCFESNCFLPQVKKAVALECRVCIQRGVCGFTMMEKVILLTSDVLRVASLSRNFYSSKEFLDS